MLSFIERIPRLINRKKKVKMTKMTVVSSSPVIVGKKGMVAASKSASYGTDVKAPLEPSPVSANEAAKAAAATLEIQIPSGALLDLEKNLPPMSVPQLSPPSLESDDDDLESLPSEDEYAFLKSRQMSMQYFFPRQARFEPVVPIIIRASDIRLKDHPMVEGEYADYDKYYHADTLLTRDGRPMVRLL